MKQLSKAKTPRLYAMALLTLCVISPAFKVSSAGLNPTSQPEKRFVCGYDPGGAEDEWHNHKLNALRVNERRALSKDISAMARTNAGLQAQDVGDIAVIEDDGTIVIPPSQFD